MIYLFPISVEKSAYVDSIMKGKVQLRHVSSKNKTLLTTRLKKKKGPNNGFLLSTSLLCSLVPYHNNSVLTTTNYYAYSGNVLQLFSLFQHIPKQHNLFASLIYNPRHYVLPF